MTEVLKKVIIYVALFMTGLLAIPAVVFLCGIMLIWKLVDKILCKLETYI